MRKRIPKNGYPLPTKNKYFPQLIKSYTIIVFLSLFLLLQEDKVQCKDNKEYIHNWINFFDTSFNNHYDRIENKSYRYACRNTVC